MRKFAVVAGVVMCVFFFGGSSWAQDLGYARSGRIWATSELTYATSFCATATAYRYGKVIDCRNVRGLELYFTFATIGATTKTKAYIEYMLDDPADPADGGPYEGVSYTAGLALTGVWTAREPLLLMNDLGASVPITTTFITAAGNYMASVVPKAPYARVVIYYHIADPDHASATAWVAKRYAPWPEHAPYTSWLGAVIGMRDW